MSLFAPRLPSEEWAAEREKIAKAKPHLALVGKDRRPDADVYRWWSVEELMERDR